MMLVQAVMSVDLARHLSESELNRGAGDDRPHLSEHGLLRGAGDEQRVQASLKLFGAALAGSSADDCLPAKRQFHWKIVCVLEQA
mmetsp:Transcript_109285/g.199110  ORF Transcript_109285/g.199110 Transcript_109285/m.199110 type:complete len:85 (+) Transcript_109285:446-700(+)